MTSEVFFNSLKFKPGDEVVVVDYPDTEHDIIGKTGIIELFDGTYWNVELDVEDGEESKYLLETEELELVNTQYKYDPKQAGDQDDDI